MYRVSRRSRGMTWVGWYRGSVSLRPLARSTGVLPSVDAGFCRETEQMSHAWRRAGKSDEKTERIRGIELAGNNCRGGVYGVFTKFTLLACQSNIGHVGKG